MSEKTITRTIKRYGNGAMVPIHRADLEELDAAVGSTVQITLRKVDDSYEATRKSAKRMRQRFSRTLELLGR
ncbi:hypothetical protein NUH88_08915 [Nisaea acidiphila]|uniref:Uncharacterized protein n=1 Tax=Nisaea acidiphila TaxID=1862145 RepID=A0A9J7AX02_9PROT|nr:hypothetical protein [Nisaea acidiphila]UUX51808.1 hypothetical protein NUH88_08915 [Nisaea acidiphila]